MLEQNEKFNKRITNALNHLSSNPQTLYFTSDIPFLGHLFLNSYQLWNILIFMADGIPRVQLKQL